MNRQIKRSREESSGWKTYPLAGYYLISSNLLLTLAILGSVLLAIGAFFLPSWNEILAGMFGVWGASLVAIGLGSFSLFWLNRKISGING
jgi:uncharacterized membrane protein